LRKCENIRLLRIMTMVPAAGYEKAPFHSTINLMKKTKP